MDMSTVEILCWVFFGIMALALIIYIVGQYKKTTIATRIKKAIKKKDFYKFSRMLKKVFSRDDFCIEWFFSRLEKIYVGDYYAVFDTDHISQELFLDKSLFFETLHVIQNTINTSKFADDIIEKCFKECIKNIYVIDSDGNQYKVNINNNKVENFDSFNEISDKEEYVILKQPIQWIKTDKIKK